MTMRPILTSLALGLFAGTAMAQSDYPDRPVTIVVPWDAGGGTDTIIRLFAGGFEEEMGVPINVVNRTGGSGVVGHSAIAQARPDGYTLGACTSEITYFDALGLAPITPDSFDLISRLAVIPAGLTVSADSDYRSVDDVIKALRDGELGTMTSSGSGLGGPWHMAAAGMAQAAGEPADKINFIPSKGGAPALQDLVSGGLSMFTGSPVEARALAEAGEVRILAIMSDERSDAFPDVPTLKESGYDFSLTNWFSLCAPKGLPDDVKAKIVAAAETAAASDQVQEALAQRGITPTFDGPEAFTSFAEEFAVEAKTLLTDMGIAQ